MRFYFTLLLILGIFRLQSQASFTDDFEAYTNGAYLAASNNKWTTWSKKPGTDEDTKITEEQAKSGKNSVKIINTVPAGGATDLVLPFGGKYTTGRFTYKMSMFIPTGKNAYFNFQATQTIGQTWAIDANFTEDGAINISRSSVPLLSSPYPKNEWFDLEIDINLSSNVWKVLVNGECRGAFSNGTNSVASIDIFPINSASLFYIDDVSFQHDPSVVAYANDGGISDFIWAKGKLAGTTNSPTCALRNNGTSPITSAEMTVIIDGISTPANISNINLLKGQKADIILPELTLKPGSNVIEVVINKLNGAASDEVMCNNTLKFNIDAAQPAPHRAVLVEEGTGTWCQWCPRGAVFMDRYDEQYHKLFIPIAVHNGSTDPMLLPEYNSFMAFTAFPNSKVNRLEEIDPSGTEAPFLSEISKPAKAKLTTGARYNEVNKNLDVSVEVEFLEDIDGEFYVSLVLTEDGVKGTASGYNQANAYAGGASGVMGGFETLPNPVPAATMVYDHVARAVSGLRSNNNNSFSGSYKAGDKIVLTYAFTLNAAWKFDNINIIPILLDAGNYINAASNTIAEAVQNGFISSTGNIVLASDQVKIYPNPAKDFLNVDLNIESSGEVEVQIVDVEGKTVAFRNYGVLQGSFLLPVHLNHFKSGLYLVRIKTKEGVRIEKLIVE